MSKNKDPFKSWKSKDSWQDDDVAGDEPPEHDSLPENLDSMHNWLYHDEHSKYL